ncbi:MAG: DUF167 domain-containing protein [Patescibacteria group bacterium]|nr:DUF167 domain-containing protein [Patescibacteria group bacterium]MDD5490937.1 DUF167 domain-containing protein [Patescibacteria group bacterium]
MTIKVKVIPRAKHQKIEKLPDGSFKVYLNAPPLEGRANEALIKILSKEFGVSKSEVEIIRGEKGKAKVVKIF